MTCTGLVEQRTLKMLMRVRSPPSTVSVVLAEAGCRSKAWCPALSQMLLTGITPEPCDSQASQQQRCSPNSSTRMLHLALTKKGLHVHR